MNTIKSWLRVALIDLAFDFRKFGVLIACLALGVATIAAVGSVGAALDAAIARDARSFLGGDLEASLGYRPANADELALFQRLGKVSEVVEIASRATAGPKSALIALRAIDSAYPLVGSVEVTPTIGGTQSLPALLAPQNGIYGAVAEPLLFDRLGVKPGDVIRIGNESFRLSGTLDALPDQAARGFALGATVLVSEPSLAATGIIGPGVIARYRYKINLGGRDYDAAAAEIRRAFPDAGWQVRSPREAAASLTRYLDIFDRFLVLVGLSSLLVGGIGVSNAASAYVNDRERSIATLRSLGATGRRVMVHFMLQVMLLGVVGMLLGLVLGTVSTLVVLPLLGSYLTVDLPAAIYPLPLLTGAAFGLVIAFVFAYLPLLRAARLSPASLFRAAGGFGMGRLPWRRFFHPRIGGPLLLGVLLLGGLALATTHDAKLVLWYALGVVVAFLAFRFVSWLLQFLLRRLRPARGLVPRLALRNIYRRGAPTPTVVLSLGLGLTLMLSIALVDSSVRGQLGGDLTKSAPSFVLMNVDKPTVAALTTFAATDKAVTSLDFVPYLRGIVTKLNGKAIADVASLDDNDRLHLGGDQALSWRADLPPGDVVLSGKWWASDYAGPPLVSLDDDFAAPLGLKVGDTMGIAISGRPLDVTVANIRRVDWQNASLSFAILFSPGVIESAPATDLGALKADPADESKVEAALVQQFPALAFIPVSEALTQISSVIGALANAVVMVGGVALLSGVFVLAGALAAGRRQREADAVVVKVLGATRRQLALAFVLEYGLLGLLAAIVAAGLGAIAGWAIIAHVLQLRFIFDWQLTIAVAIGAVAVTILTGLLTTWSTLTARPAAFLRAEE
jgi:putative ABC transport system permease protein